MKLLFLCTHAAKPGFRFRVEPMLPLLAARGHQCDAAFLAGNALGRLSLYRRLPDYDAVILQQRLLSPGEVVLIRRRAKRLIYDLDEAVMFNTAGERDRRRQARFRTIVQASDLVLCGNRSLADEVRQAGGRVEIVPTVVDTDRFHPRLRAASQGGSGLVTVGWTGGSSTNRPLNDLLPVLARLEGTIRLKVITDSMLGLDLARLGGVPFEAVGWSPPNEVAETASFDIGVMPLPKNPWTRGKCGCPALQYMSLGLPAVCSRVGVNCEILEHGVTGFLPASEEEWRSILEQLARDAGLRSLVGRAGRSRVVAAYSTAAVGPRFVELVEGAAAARLRRSA